MTDEPIARPLAQGGLDLVFSCEGTIDGSVHGEIVTDLTGLLQGGNPICSEEECTGFDEEADYVGFAPSDDDWTALEPPIKTDVQTEPPSWGRGSWMQTFTGIAFRPLDPRPQDIDARDIAHALANLCRYNGHVVRHYSVAEHCVHLSHLVPERDALWALLHDATEAYVGDMIRPLKQHMPDFVAAEDRVMAAIAEKFGLDPAMPASVHDADTRILLDERAALLGPSPEDWGVAGEPFGIEIHAWTPATAEIQYLRRLDELLRWSLE